MNQLVRKTLEELTLEGISEIPIDDFFEGCSPDLIGEELGYLLGNQYSDNLKYIWATDDNYLVFSEQEPQHNTFFENKIGKSITFKRYEGHPLSSILRTFERDGLTLLEPFYEKDFEKEKLFIFNSQ